MYTNVNELQFMEAFKDMGRMDNFSPEGLRTLYAYLTEMEGTTGEPIELDVIAICCDFSEEPLDDVLKNYGLEDVEELDNNTLAIGLENGNVLYQIF